MSGVFDVAYRYEGGKWFFQRACTPEQFQQLKEDCFMGDVVVVRKDGKMVASHTKMKEIIGSICHDQYETTGGVLPPEYCLVCQGCLVGGILSLVGRQG